MQSLSSAGSNADTVSSREGRRYPTDRPAKPSGREIKEGWRLREEPKPQEDIQPFPSILVTLELVGDEGKVDSSASPVSLELYDDGPSIVFCRIDNKKEAGDVKMVYRDGKVELRCSNDDTVNEFDSLRPER